MSTLPSRPGSAQLSLFPRPYWTPSWQELPGDAQQKILRILTQILQEHRRRRCLDRKTRKEARDE